jgi:hypothetical protein
MHYIEPAMGTSEHWKCYFLKEVQDQIHSQFSVVSTRRRDLSTAG